MRTPSLLLAIGSALLFTAIPNADAAKKPGKGERRGEGRLLSRFDRDHNGTLDTQESDRVRKAFNALKNLDTDKNGDLSDTEISAAKLAEPRKRKKK